MEANTTSPLCHVVCMAMQSASENAGIGHAFMLGEVRTHARGLVPSLFPVWISYFPVPVTKDFLMVQGSWSSEMCVCNLLKSWHKDAIALCDRCRFIWVICNLNELYLFGEIVLDIDIDIVMLI